MTRLPRSAQEFRLFALQHHPDRGGDPAVFAAGLAAWRRAQGASDGAPRVVFYRRRRRRDRLVSLVRTALAPASWPSRRSSRHVERRVR